MAAAMGVSHWHTSCPAAGPHFVRYRTSRQEVGAYVRHYSESQRSGGGGLEPRASDQPSLQRGAEHVGLRGGAARTAPPQCFLALVEGALFPARRGDAGAGPASDGSTNPAIGLTSRISKSKYGFPSQMIAIRRGHRTPATLSCP